MTATQIHRKVRVHKKVSLRQVQNYIYACRIQHVGVRQRPQEYPEDSAEIILRHLGIQNGKVSHV